MVRFRLAFIILFLSTLSHGQFLVSGNIEDEKQEPIGFCHVINKTLGMGKISDKNGNFSITARKDDTLQFSYVGYKTLDIILSSVHLMNYLKVVLPEDSLLLPSITIFADRQFRVPINLKGQPIIMPGINDNVAEKPIKPGSVKASPSGVANVPIPGATIYGPITYFSKDEREKRQAEEAYIETRETITFQKFIAQDTVRQELCRLYKLDSSQYDRIVVRLNEQFPGIQKQHNPAEIWNWLLMHFNRQAPVIKDY
jgi:hypothetical protein